MTVRATTVTFATVYLVAVLSPAWKPDAIPKCQVLRQVLSIMPFHGNLHPPMIQGSLDYLSDSPSMSLLQALCYNDVHRSITPSSPTHSLTKKKKLLSEIINIHVICWHVDRFHVTYTSCCCTGNPWGLLPSCVLSSGRPAADNRLSHTQSSQRCRWTLKEQQQSLLPLIQLDTRRGQARGGAGGDFSGHTVKPCIKTRCHCKVPSDRAGPRPLSPAAGAACGVCWHCSHWENDIALKI